MYWLITHLLFQTGHISYNERNFSSANKMNPINNCTPQCIQYLSVTRLLNSTIARLHDCWTARLHDYTTARLYDWNDRTTSRSHDCTTAELHDCTISQTHNLTTARLLNRWLHDCTTSRPHDSPSTTRRLRDRTIARRHHRMPDLLHVLTTRPWARPFECTAS